jgi:hypothetical protein
VQNHRRWVFDALFVGAVTLATSGMAGWIRPDRADAAIAGGTIGAGMATAYVSRRHLEQERLGLDPKLQLQAILHRHNSEIERQLQALRMELLENLKELKRRQQSINDSNSAKIEQQAQEIDQIKQQIKEIDRRLSEEKKIVSDPSIVKQNASPTPISKKNLELDSELQHPQKAIAWLKDKGILVESYTLSQTSVVEDALNKIAVQLGENYLSLAAFHAQLKYHSYPGRGIGFQVNLKNKTQEDIKINIDFATELNDFGFVRARCSNAEKLIHVGLDHKEDFRHFIQGNWFERFIDCKVSQLLRAKELHYEYLLNPKGVFPNNKPYEIDQFYWVEGQPIWIECKSGKNHDNYLDQYSKAREILGVSKSQAFMVVLNIPPNQSEIRTQRWNITVTDQDTLLDKLDDRFDEILHQKTAIADNLPQASTLIPERDPLEATEIKPFPEIRRQILTALVALFANPDYQPKPLKAINRLLKDRLNESISLSKINRVQQAFMRAGLFYDRGKHSIALKHYYQAIARLRYANVEQLERRFIEQHAKEVLKLDATFFDHRDTNLKSI